MMKLKKKSKDRRQHPCWGWCGQRILGIVENKKLLGDLPSEFRLEVRSAIGLTWVPGGALELTCQHGRKYIGVPKRG